MRIFFRRNVDDTPIRQYVPFIIGGVLMIVLILWGVLAWQRHVQLLKPGNLLHVLPGSQNGYIHIQWTKETVERAQQLSDSSLGGLDIIGLLVGAITWRIDVNGEEREALMEALGNEIAWYAPDEDDDRFVFVAEIKDSERMIDFLTQRDPNVTFTDDGEYKSATIRDSDVSRLLAWSERETDSLNVIIAKKWIAVSFDVNDFKMLVGVANRTETKLYNVLPHAERVKGYLAHGMLPTQLTNLVPTLLAADETTYWWNATLDESLTLRVRDSLASSYDLLAPLSENTITVQAKPKGNDIVVEGMLRSDDEELQTIGELFQAVTATPLTTILELFNEKPYTLVIREGTAIETLVRVPLDEDESQGTIAIIETTLTRTLARQSLKYQERTLYDGTVVNELFPNPGAVERRSIENSPLGTITSWGIVGQEPGYYTIHEKDTFTLSTSIQLIDDYTSQPSSDNEQKCQLRGETVIQGPMDAFDDRLKDIHGRVVIAQSSSEKRMELDICLPL